MTIKLEVGKRYVDRRGRVCGPLFAVDDAWYPFECRVRNENWTDDGRYYHNDTEDSSWDLIIALAPDEAQQSSESDGALLLAYEKALIVAARNLDPEALSKPTVVELRATILARLSQPDELATLRGRVEALSDPLDWRICGIIELAVRNPNVKSYMEHWEARAEKAEAENARLREALEKIAKNSSDETNPNLSSQDSQGNYDDVFYDGMRQGDYYTAEIARAALARTEAENG